MNNNTLDKLKSINWDFKKRKIIDKDAVFPFNNRKYHSYPATFIPEIPFTLVEILSKERDVVLDPFGGIGTTLVQALIQNRFAISIDNNPIANLIAEDFYNLFNPSIDLEEALQALLMDIDGYDCAIDYSCILDSSQRELVDWYDPVTFNELAYLVYIYKKIKYKNSVSGEKNLYHLCLSNLLTSVSAQHGGWAYIADNVKPKKEKMVQKIVIERFKNNLIQCVKGIQVHKGRIDSGLYLNNALFKSTIRGDLRNINIECLRNTIDLIITSPPYPKMIDYVKSQRLSFYLDGLPMSKELGNEIGARCRRNMKGTIDEYIADMTICNRKMIECLKTGGYLCYVLPMFSKDTDNERKKAIESVIENCEQTGLEIVFQVNRAIPGTQRSNNIKWATLKKEQIVILEKQ